MIPALNSNCFRLKEVQFKKNKDYRDLSCGPLEVLGVALPTGILTIAVQGKFLFLNFLLSSGIQIIDALL